MYAVINKFKVEKKHQKAFIKETKNIWIKNYRKSPGFVKTIILSKGDEFLTIDLWKSKKYPDRFFKKNLKTLEEANNVPTRYISRKSYVMI